MDLSDWDDDAIQDIVNPRNDPLLKYEVMNEVPGGRFLMGTDASDANHGENPSKTISVRPFHIDRYPVTVAHFKRFLRIKRRYKPETYTTGYSYVLKGLQSRYVDHQSVELDKDYPEYIRVYGANWKLTQGQGSDISDSMLHPVTHISFDDAQAYCMWKKKRLPTEAEWEYASRGGLEEKRYPWGGKFKKNRCNLWQGSFPSGNSEEDGHVLTSPVDAYPSQNSLGLYDMLGNVWEWTTSLYREKGMDLAKLKKGRTFVVKGCSFIDSSIPDEANHLARVTARRGFIANFTAQNVGFRCALSDSDAQAMGIKRVPGHVEL